MKLKKYIKTNKMTYAEFAQKVGSISGVTIFRFASGERRPSHELLNIITELTHGEVTAADFDPDDQPARAPRIPIEKGDKKKRAGLPQETHLNAALVREYRSFYDGIRGTPVPVSIALAEFGERVDVHHSKYYLDARPISLPMLIDLANKRRVARGLVKILYPGCTHDEN